MKLIRILMMLAVCTLLVAGVSCSSNEATTYQLTTVIFGQGSVSPSSGTYASGSAVTLTAFPLSGWEFDHWGNQASGTQNPTTITMDGDKLVYAYFIEAEATSASGFTTYTDNQLGFSIFTPDSWETNTGESFYGSDYWIFFFSFSWCAKAVPFGGVTKIDAEGYTSLQNYYSDVINTLLKDEDDYQLISKENMTIDGIPAIKIIYTSSSDGTNWQEMLSFFIKQQEVWWIVGACDIECWDTYEGTFNTMANSFHVLD